MKNEELCKQLNTIFSVNFFDDSFNPDGQESEIAENLLNTYE